MLDRDSVPDQLAVGEAVRRTRVTKGPGSKAAGLAMAFRLLEAAAVVPEVVAAVAPAGSARAEPDGQDEVEPGGVGEEVGDQDRIVVGVGREELDRHDPGGPWHCGQPDGWLGR